MELTNEEKASIVTQHIKSVSSNLYNLQVSLIAENAVSPANEENIASLNQQMSVEVSKMSALEEELSVLQV